MRVDLTRVFYLKTSFMELIKISENEGKKVVNARDLHNFLVVEAKGGQVGEMFAHWIKRNLEYLDAKEGVNYITIEYDYLGNEIAKNSKSDNQKVSKREYALNIDLAKEISMVQNNDKGKQARQYFIECEGKLKRPLSPAEILIQQGQMMLEIERKQSQIENRLEKIEELAVYNAPVEHMSVMGYCHNIGKKIDNIEGSKLSRKCKKICTDQGLFLGKITDPRWGSVNTYPINVLEDVIGKQYEERSC